MYSGIILLVLNAYLIAAGEKIHSAYNFTAVVVL